MGFTVQTDGKTYLNGSHKVYWCSTGCNTAFVYYVAGKQKHSLNGKAYASIYNFLTSSLTHSHNN